MIALAMQMLSNDTLIEEENLRAFLEAVQKLLYENEDARFESSLIVSSFVSGVTAMFEQNARYVFI